MNLACILIRNTLPFTVFWCWCSLIYMEWLGYFSLTRENGYWVLMSLQFCQWIFNLGYKCACLSCEEWVSWHRFWLISRSWTLQIMFGQSASLNTWEGIIDLKVVGYHNLPLELFLVRCICFWRPTILQMDASWPMWRNLWQAIIIWKRVLFIYAVLSLYCIHCYHPSNWKWENSCSCPH